MFRGIETRTHPVKFKRDKIWVQICDQYKLTGNKKVYTGFILKISCPCREVVYHQKSGMVIKMLVL